MLRSECIRIIKDYLRQFNTGIEDFLEYCEKIEKLDKREIDIVLSIGEEEGYI